MKKIFAVMITVLLLTLVGCSSQGKLTRDDLCIQRVDDEAKICYGMERGEIEKIAGKGESSPIAQNRFRYENDLTVLYRDNTAVLIGIEGEKLYAHISGAVVGELPDDLRGKYGQPSFEIQPDSQENKFGYLIYDYDLKNKKLLKKDDLNDSQVVDQPQDYIKLSFDINGNGYLHRITVGDIRAFMLAQ